MRINMHHSHGITADVMICGRKIATHTVKSLEFLYVTLTHAVDENVDELVPCVG